MICKSCGFDNDKNALFCRKCHANLVEAYLEDYESGKTYNLEDNDSSEYEEKQNDNDDRKSDNNKGNTKTKTKSKTKTKTKTKEKEKTKKDKGKNKNNTVYKEKTPFGTKVLIVLMTLMILGMAAAIAFIGYKYYEKNYNIKVPNLIGLTYEEAEVKLAKKDLNISKKEITVEDEEDVGKVLKQSKKEGSKTKKGATVKVKVGVLDNTYKMPNLVGLNADEATKKLNQDNLKYNIIYETSDEEENTVIEQSVPKYTEIDKEKTITLKVSKEKTSVEKESEKKEQSNAKEE